MDTAKEKSEAPTSDTASTETTTTSPETAAPAEPAATPSDQAVPATTQATVTTPEQTVTTQPAAEPLPPKVENFMQQPHAQQPLSPDSHHTRKFMTKLLVVLIVVLLIIALALGYILTMGRTKSVKSNSQAVAPTVHPTVTPTPDPLANWQTYTGKETTFIYPQMWKALDTTKDAGLKTVTEAVTLTSQADTVSSAPGDMTQIFVMVYSSPMPSTFPKTTGSSSNEPVKPVTIGDYTGIRGTSIDQSGHSSDMVYLKNPAGGYVSLMLSPMSSTTNGMSEKIFEKFLTSFKFVSAAQTTVSPTVILSPTISQTP